MKDKRFWFLWVIIAGVLLTSPIWLSYSRAGQIQKYHMMIIGQEQGTGFSSQDFSTYTETDPNTRITVTSAKVSWVGLARNEDAYVYKDMTANYFSGDFTHRFEVQFSNASTWPIIWNWALTNEVDDMKGISDGAQESDDYVGFFWYNDNNENFYLRISEDGSLTSDSWLNGPTASTTYYVTVTRDDDAGANSTGQVTAYIRIGSHTGTLQDTLQVDCGVGEQNDFQYIFGVNTFNSGNAYTGDGYTENLEIKSSL